MTPFREVTFTSFSIIAGLSPRLLHFSTVWPAAPREDLDGSSSRRGGGCATGADCGDARDEPTSCEEHEKGHPLSVTKDRFFQARKRPRSLKIPVKPNGRSER